MEASNEPETWAEALCMLFCVSLTKALTPWASMERYSKGLSLSMLSG